MLHSTFFLTHFNFVYFHIDMNSQEENPKERKVDGTKDSVKDGGVSTTKRRKTDGDVDSREAERSEDERSEDERSEDKKLRIAQRLWSAIFGEEAPDLCTLHQESYRDFLRKEYGCSEEQGHDMIADKCLEVYNGKTIVSDNTQSFYYKQGIFHLLSSNRVNDAYRVLTNSKWLLRRAEQETDLESLIMDAVKVRHCLEKEGRSSKDKVDVMIALIRALNRAGPTLTRDHLEKTFIVSDDGSMQVR